VGVDKGRVVRHQQAAGPEQGVTDRLQSVVALIHIQKTRSKFPSPRAASGRRRRPRGSCFETLALKVPARLPAMGLMHVHAEQEPVRVSHGPGQEESRIAYGRAQLKHTSSPHRPGTEAQAAAP
jgi:hypothetical protein